MPLDVRRGGSHVAEREIGAAKDGVDARCIEPTFSRKGRFRERAIRVEQAVGVRIRDE